MQLLLAHHPARHGLMALNATEWPKLLVSFVYKDVDGLTYTPTTMTLDSGAYTAWTKNATIDVNDYADWAVAMQQRFPNLQAINLDVIPGRKGRSPSAEERAQGMAQSLENADALRDRGLPVMEVFHQYEPVAFLRQLMERRRPGELLGISIRKGISAAEKRKFTADVLALLVAECGGHQSLPPCHGLGIINWTLMTMFPWYAVDTSAWAGVYRWGVMHHPTRADRTRTRQNVSEMFGGDAPLYWRFNPDETQMAVRFQLRYLNWMEDQATELWRHRGVTWEATVP